MFFYSICMSVCVCVRTYTLLHTNTPSMLSTHSLYQSIFTHNSFTILHTTPIETRVPSSETFCLYLFAEFCSWKHAQNIQNRRNGKCVCIRIRTGNCQRKVLPHVVVALSCTSAALQHKIFSVQVWGECLRDQIWTRYVYGYAWIQSECGSPKKTYFAVSTASHRTLIITKYRANAFL